MSPPPSRGGTNAIARAGASSQSVTTQELALEGRQDGYESGLLSSLEVLDAARDLFGERRDLARARYEVSSTA